MRIRSGNSFLGDSGRLVQSVFLALVTGPAVFVSRSNSTECPPGINTRFGSVARGSSASFETLDRTTTFGWPSPKKEAALPLRKRK